MFIRRKKELTLEEELNAVISPYDNWFNDEGNDKNEEAKQALITFYYKLKKAKIKKEKKSDLFDKLEYNWNILSHVMFSVVAKEALEEKKYMRACNEIVTFIYRQPYFHKGVRYNLLNLLQEYLNV